MSRRRTHHRTSDSMEKIYFAYGSNLFFEQMAKRCPDSRLLGRARLHHYKFQINERGFANVVDVTRSDPESFVEGLCYLLTETDEAKLDRAEGVPTVYIKKALKVDFTPGPALLLGRKVSDIVRDHGVTNYVSGITSASSSQYQYNWLGKSQGTTESIKALVYLSVDHVQPGSPWDEYIGRMERGIQDALTLGISPAFVENDIRPHLQFGRGIR